MKIQRQRDTFAYRIAGSDWKQEGYGRSVLGDPRKGGAYQVSRQSDGDIYRLHHRTLTGYGDDAQEDLTLLGEYPSEQDAQEAAEKQHAQRQRTASLTEDFLDNLDRQFHQWNKCVHDGEVGSRDWQCDLGNWNRVEKFLGHSYPAAHRDLPYCLEHARPLLRDQNYDFDGNKLHDDMRYETGPEAVAQHGYDPKEVAAGMVLLHNSTNNHGGPGGERDRYVAQDVDLLHDIFQKRVKMQRQYEQRVAAGDERMQTA